MRKLILLVILFISCTGLNAQNNLDSLLGAWNNKSLSDSLRVDAYKSYIWFGFLYSNPDTAVALADNLHLFAREKNYLRADADGYGIQGTANWFRSNYPAAQESYTKGKEIYEQIGNKRGVANCLSGLGSINKEQGNYPLALDYFHKCLTIQEELENKSDIAGSLNNIGNIYRNQREYELALDYYQRSLTIKEEIGDKKGSAGNLHNIGLVYDLMGKKELALEFYLKAKAINEETNNKQWLSNNISCIGIIYREQGEFEKALEYFRQCLAIDTEINNRANLSATYNNIGFSYRQVGKTALALEYCEKGLSLSKEIGSLEWQKSACECLYLTHKDLGNNKEALRNFEQMVKLKDSIFNEENVREITQLDMQYAFDKKQLADSLQFEEERKINEVKLQQASTQRYALFGGLILIALFAGFMYNRFRVTQRQKNIIEIKEQETQKQNLVITEQNELIKKRHNEITASIEYAKRIQTAILPPPRVVKEFLRNSFILYLPKDIVAGDFYWMDSFQFEGDKLIKSTSENALESGNLINYIAACDCTGHGVPGAMVSVVCNNALNRSINEFGLRLPGEIFDKTRELVIENFSKSDDEVKDGMDASLVAFNTETRRIFWSGANNPLWIYRSELNAIEEIKADKQPIGKGYEASKFTTHEIQLNEGDIFYLFTDGYADQFGGENNKKLTKLKFRNKLLSIADLNMEDQLKELLQYHDEWRVKEEQVDDILVIGVRVS
ncbi:MAG: tetratricopeptide repeat protein [Bacteroidia bacterium]